MVNWERAITRRFAKGGVLAKILSEEDRFRREFFTWIRIPF